MTAADLIAELSRYPGYLPVKVVLSEICGVGSDREVNDEAPPIRLCRDDALEAGNVVYEGAFILIESR